MNTYLESKRLELRQTPIILHIAKENGNGKIGRAIIREGSLTWYPGYAQKGHKISWQKLGNMVSGKVPKRKKRKIRGK